MTTQQATLVRLVRLLEQARVPYAVIGGLANIVWGEPRATLDIDVLVWVAEKDIEGVIARLGAAFMPLVPEPLPFIRSTRVLPLTSSEQVRIDLVFGVLAFEEEAIRRARQIDVEGASVRFCSAEDLVLMKIASDREKDLADARAIVRRRMAEFDLDYVEPRVRELASLLDRPEIAARWEQWKAEARYPPTP